ncbi:MAG: hypothetical protein IPL96_15090 [Holophagaceae bacterium]|nr:hypothetical protein [Holophagaceae bacterium]
MTPPRPSPASDRQVGTGLGLAACGLALLAACGGGSGNGGGNPDPKPGVFTLALEQELPSTCAELYLSAHADAAGRAFVYVAAKEGGLKVFDQGRPAVLKKTLPAAQLGGLHAMNLHQTGNLLVVALGNHFGTNPQAAGVALVDVADPANPVVKSVWSDPALPGGCGAAVSDGRFVYLGAMRNGVVVLDAQNPAAPAFVSRFVPDLNFPDASPDPAKINARGLGPAGQHPLPRLRRRRPADPGCVRPRPPAGDRALRQPGDERQAPGLQQRGRGWRHRLRCRGLLRPRDPECHQPNRHPAPGLVESLGLPGQRPELVHQ